MINKNIFEKFKKSKSKILAVTKYWDKTKTEIILKEINLKYPEVFFWVWENRIENIIEKWIERKNMHFI